MRAHRQADQALVASDGAASVSTLTGFDPSRVRDVVRRLELIRGWKRRGGSTPGEPMPSVFTAVDEAINIIKELTNA